MTNIDLQIWGGNGKRLPLGDARALEVDVEELTRRVEGSGADIAPSYEEWCRMGFALCDGLGEGGRTYFKRLSALHPDYEAATTDKQYDKCINSHGGGITVRTLFHLAKTAGVEIGRLRCMDKDFVAEKRDVSGAVCSASLLDSSPEGLATDEDEEKKEEALPVFPPSVYVSLPELLKRVCSHSVGDSDKDMLLIGSITALSACLPSVYGVYAGRELFPNLYLFVTAMASAGKGRLMLCRRLVEPIHEMRREESKAAKERYQQELSELASHKNAPEEAKPPMPPMKMLIIPANNSATGFFQLLSDNDGEGLIFETEGDTLAKTFKSYYGDFSDGYRKIFHHEPVTYNRRKEREYVEIRNPRMSAVMSGTPLQISSLIPDAENGLFSRFMFYRLDGTSHWMDVFEESDGEPLDMAFLRLGEEAKQLYVHLKGRERFRFVLTKSQQQRFNEYFSAAQNRYVELLGNDYIGTVRRLGVICFRLSMVLGTLRMLEGVEDEEGVMVCMDEDFDCAMEMTKVLIRHAAMVFSRLPKAQMPTPNAGMDKKVRLLKALPERFDRKGYLKVGEELGIPLQTADKQIVRFIKSGSVIRVSHGLYEKRM